MARDPNYSLPKGSQRPKPGPTAAGKGKGRTNALADTSKPAKALERAQTTEEIAEIFSVHAKTVRKWVKEKCPSSRRKGVIYLNDGEVQHWLTVTGRKTTPGRPPEEKPPVPPELGGDKDYWLARKYRRECLQKEGVLMEVQDVKRWISEHITTAKNKLIGLGAAIASMLEGRDEAERQLIIEERIGEVLNELSGSAAGFGSSVEAA